MMGSHQGKDMKILTNYKQKCNQESPIILSSTTNKHKMLNVLTYIVMLSRLVVCFTALFYSVQLFTFLDFRWFFVLPLSFSLSLLSLPAPFASLSPFASTPPFPPLTPSPSPTHRFTPPIVKIISPTSSVDFIFSWDLQLRACIEQKSKNQQVF